MLALVWGVSITCPAVRPAASSSPPATASSTAAFPPSHGENAAGRRSRGPAPQSASVGRSARTYGRACTVKRMSDRGAPAPTPPRPLSPLPPPRRLRLPLQRQRALPSLASLATDGSLQRGQPPPLRRPPLRLLGLVELLRALSNWRVRSRPLTPPKKGLRAPRHFLRFRWGDQHRRTRRMQ